ncbi:MAG: [citrate (pro-3S)-lyase] ligase [Psychrilyobacter sp.]|uniref:[citrate (pro-3S)-lyase] ligase n=1 Tax=Psychrilyobacter sp. TaxID=2586924 RepID=UPI003C739AF8
MNYIVEKLHLTNVEEVNEVRSFLSTFQLDYEKDIDYTVVIRDNNKIIASCSKSKDILKGFAVNQSVQGEGITNLLIKAIQDRLFQEGIFHSFIFTKPIYETTFKSLAYKVLASVEEVTLLEYGFNDIHKSLAAIKKLYNIDNSTPKTALVMNCNPFTLGHRYLIEKASLNSKEVLVFIVEEDKSLFPFEDRYQMTKNGVADLKNVTVIPGGKYIISSATFPSYFLREETKILSAYTKLDATIFSKYFCKQFNITKRMLGEEPYCPVTKSYNEALVGILENHGVEVDIIPRKWISTPNNYISASKVRNLIKKEGREALDHLSEFIPPVTINYLKSEEGKEVIKKIINSNTPH